MDSPSILKTLGLPSAKIWYDEENCKIDESVRINAPRWLKNWEVERRIYAQRGIQVPITETLKFHGAFINKDGEDYVPELKKKRSQLLHDYGFS